MTELTKDQISDVISRVCSALKKCKQGLLDGKGSMQEFHDGIKWIHVTTLALCKVLENQKDYAIEFRSEIDHIIEACSEIGERLSIERNELLNNESSSINIDKAVDSYVNVDRNLSQYEAKLGLNKDKDDDNVQQD